MHSGPWRGWWEQLGLGRQQMDDLILTFSFGALSGWGHDCIGGFTLQGNYGSNGSVSFVKQYTGRHAVMYQGQSTGEGVIYGHWLIPKRGNGRFALAPDGKSTDLPIRELTAADLATRTAPPAPLPEPAVHRQDTVRRPVGRITRGR